MYGLQLKNAPLSEPVTVETLKQHLRLNLAEEDTLLALYLTSARQLIENLTGRALISQTWTLFLDAWPSGVLYLPKCPTQAITAVRYYDSNDEQQTHTDYHSTPEMEPCRLWFNTLPALSPTLLPPIQVDFLAGYGNAENVPQLLKQAIMLLAAQYYQQREAVGPRVDEVPFGLRNIINQYRIVEV